MRRVLFFFVGGLAVAACATSQPAQRGASPAAPSPSATPTAKAQPADAQVSPQAERTFADANEAYADQEKAGAINYADIERRYQQAADADPNFAEPEYNLGVIFEREGKVDLAAAAYAEALRRNSALVRASENLAMVKMAQGKDAEAQSLLEAAAKAHPRDAGVRARLSELSLRQADSDKARAWAREALVRDSKNITAYRVLLEIALRQGDDDMVRLLALRAQKAQPQEPLPNYYLGKLALRRKDPQKAVTYFRAALGMKPDFEPALVETANMAIAGRDYTGAETVLRKILQIDPTACSAHLALGVCERGLSHSDVAASEYEEAAKCDPKLLQAYYDLGLLEQHQRNNCGGAIEQYRKFISSQPSPLPGDHPVFAALQECQERKATDDQKKAEPPSPPPPAAAGASGASAPPAAAGSVNVSPTPTSAPTPASTGGKDQAPPPPPEQGAPTDPNEPKS